MIWLMVEQIIFFEKSENFGQKWGNSPIIDNKSNIEIFATSPQRLVFDTAVIRKMMIQKFTDLILFHTLIK